MGFVDILYVFAHPDDESFGPQLAMLRQVAAGHAVHLLCLTRGGGATAGGEVLTRRELQELRSRELTAAAAAIGCASLRLGTFPDGRLHQLDPRIVERPLAATLEVVDPALVVTFPHHGINGHGDHCTVHAVTRHAFCAWRERVSGPRRLAFIGLEAGVAARVPGAHGLASEAVAWRIAVDRPLLERAQRILDHHASQAPTVAEYRPLEWFEHGLVGTLFEADPGRPLEDLTQGL